MARIDNTGSQVPLVIKQGADFGPIQLSFKNPDGSAVDLTGCTLRGQIRKKAQDATVAAEFVFSITDAPGGLATLTLTDTVTSGIACGERMNDEASRYVYDIELVDAAGIVISPLWGDVTVLREVTR